ncbi:alpha/beta hydrolase-fold protein, partial [Bacteroidota bacterium]
IADIPAGEYYVQAFINLYTEFKRSDGHTLWMHNDQGEGQSWRRSPGNMYSDVKKVNIDPSKAQTIELSCSTVIPPIPPKADTKWVKRIKIKSKLLSDFWGQPIYIGATILLPKNYDRNTNKHYPVNYIQGHFSSGAPYGFRDNNDQGNSRGRSNISEYWKSDECPEMLAITLLHPCPYYDDSYVVNSPNVGPYDDAIMKELIPHLEEQFRIIKEPYARILSGGSTGGWISLAMQVFHPDFFGGTFSLCPDPVDFHYHQIVNIYEDKNAYFKEYEWMKVERPNTRGTDGNIRTTMENENLYELVVGDKSRSGGQWDIWEAAYSPIGEDGYPKRIWNKRTGEIDNEVAKEWEKFDIHHYLKENWSTIGPKLEGKLFIYTGSMDSYYLNNAVVLLEDYLNKTKYPYYDGKIEYGLRKPHCWGPRGKDLIKLMGDQVAKNAPSGTGIN